MTVKKLTDEVEKLKDNLEDSLNEVDTLKLKVIELDESLEALKKERIDERKRDES